MNNKISLPVQLDNLLSNNSNHQSGAVLVISLIMLLLLTLIGISSIQTTSLEEKMAGNLRDRNIAFQAAESAIRDAEQDIRGIGTTPRSPAISGITDFYINCNMDNVANTYDDGLCNRKWGIPSNVEPTYGITPSNPIDSTCPTTPTCSTCIYFRAFTNMATLYNCVRIDMTTTPSVAYGRFTGAAQIVGLSAQPRYLIEGYSTNAYTYYRITVRAQGISANTVVWLQAVYKQ
jgi:type IV pilus assembly protein PilX